MFDWSTVLPQSNNLFNGSRLALYYLGFLACMFTFRGCVHYFAPDGGSGIIAGIPLGSYPEGAVQTIITGFGNSGRYHLVEAALAWLIIFRWRILIPIFLLYVLITQFLGIALVLVKPLPVIPPGQIGVYVLFPLTIIFFLLSVKKTI